MLTVRRHRALALVVLADFVHEGKTIFVLRMLDPVYVVGRCGPDGSYTVPSDEEMESVGDVVEDLVGEIDRASPPRVQPHLRLGRGDALLLLEGRHLYHR